MIRQPIVCVMGHVDHGKTSLLDKVRSTTVAKREAGAITQHIGASEVPAEVIQKVCGGMLKAAKCELKIPGLLFIDTPGHEAFTNLRKRGGSVADIAVLVVDITQGFQPQTLEALSILRDYKTPFIVAANKVDLLTGWNAQKTNSFMASHDKQMPMVQASVDEKLYNLVGRLGELGFSSERFDRVSDFTKNIAIIPVSAKTGEGVAELLMVLSGVTQRFLEEQLKTEVKGPGKGSILEVKEEKGLGKTIDIILYDGTIRKNDEILFGTLNGVGSTKIRALLKPKPLDEMRDPREKFNYVEAAHAASGIKIYAPGLDDALAGSSIFVAEQDSEEGLRQEIEKEIAGILVESSGPGVILKADTLGSLEGIAKLLEGVHVPVSRAGIGQVMKKDVVDAANIGAENRYYAAVLAFNVPVLDEARTEAAKHHVPILEDEIIYSLLEKYQNWAKLEKEAEKGEAYTSMVLPGKMRIMPGCCFRAKSPIICGVEVLAGRLKSGYKLMTENGVEIGELKSIQREKKPVDEAKAGEQLAISINTQMTFGRQICEGDLLYTVVPKSHHALLTTKYKEFLSPAELELLVEIRKVTGDTSFLG